MKIISIFFIPESLHWIKKKLGKVKGSRVSEDQQWVSGWFDGRICGIFDRDRKCTQVLILKS